MSLHVSTTPRVALLLAFIFLIILSLIGLLYQLLRLLLKFKPSRQYGVIMFRLWLSLICHPHYKLTVSMSTPDMCMSEKCLRKSTEADAEAEVLRPMTTIVDYQQLASISQINRQKLQISPISPPVALRPSAVVQVLQISPVLRRKFRGKLWKVENGPLCSNLGVTREPHPPPGLPCLLARATNSNVTLSEKGDRVFATYSNTRC